MKFKEHIDSTMKILKDFQKATVDHVIEKMDGGQKKFLIADEVGLGKTIVARGILAKLYEKEYSSEKDFRVIYVCSNQALAKQNISKLNFIKETDSKNSSIVDYNSQDDRLTSLAYKPKSEKNQYGLSFKALTPATSFDSKSGIGRADERVLIYRLLLSDKGFRRHRNTLKWFLRGRKSERMWSDEIRKADKYELENKKVENQ